MKLRGIHIHQFGHFTDCELTFPSDGFQVIYGPNEAGKTTLLQFLRGWLFDFPARTPYAFQQGIEVSGFGTLQLSDGRIVELRRRKGNKNKVSIRIDGQDTDLDEGGFLRLTGHASRSLFESIFAFGLDQLSQGEESLKHESLQSALFGGGLGTVISPEGILKELEREAAELFNPSARKPVINQLLADLKTLPGRIRETSLRSDDYQKSRRAVEAADARAAELHAEVDQLRRAHARLDKLCRANQKWCALQQCRREREPLSVPRTLPLDARARNTALAEKLQDAAEELARLANLIASLERELSAIQRDPRAVSFRAEIRGCLELKQSYLEAKSDLPKLQAEHAVARQQIDRELRELRPGWTYEDLHRFEIDVVLQAEIDRRIDEARSRQTKLVEFRTLRDQVSVQLRQARADLSALGAVRNVDALVAVLADVTAYRSDLKLLETHTAEARRLEHQLAAHFKKLTPPLAPGFVALDELPVPRDGTIKQFEADFADVRERLRTTLDSLEQDRGELSDVEAKLQDLVARGAVPSLSERDQARRKRDGYWTTLRRRLIDQPDTSWFGGDLKSLGDSFDAAIRAADDLADRIYANADAVVRREELGRQRDLLRERIAQKQARISELQFDQNALMERWQAAWAPCQFTPRAPDEMRSWATEHATACETLARRDQVESELTLLREHVTSFETRLRAVCESDAEIRVLIVEAQRIVDEARDQHRRFGELTREIKRLEPQLSECDTRLQELGEREAAWKEAWQGLLMQLRLPPELEIELTQTVISRLQSTRAKLDGLPQDEGRLQAMQSRLDEFAARVRPLCEALAPDFLRDPPELAIEKLSDQLERAAEAQKQFDQLHKQLTDAADQRALAEARQDRLQAERQELFAAAECQTEAEFLDVVARAERIRQLDLELEQRTSEIDLIRAGEDREEFERQLNQEPELLEGQRHDLAQRLKVAEEQKREADGMAAVARNELERQDGSGEAALLTDQLSHKRAQLAAEVDRYVPLVFARHLLSEAVRRFERENQPEMIATVTRLFRQMTAGRYIEFDRTKGTQQGILVRRFDGVERTPEQLSSGAREQLYLAIRLAYVLHYCRQNEPLPIVMDDVLVNFDDARVCNTLATLAEVAEKVQILFFTCHPHMVALARETIPGLVPLDLPAATSSSATASA